jgi:hypothetical protein
MLVVLVCVCLVNVLICLSELSFVAYVLLYRHVISLWAPGFGYAIEFACVRELWEMCRLRLRACSIGGHAARDWKGKDECWAFWASIYYALMESESLGAVEPLLAWPMGYGLPSSVWGGRA